MRNIGVDVIFTADGAVQVSRVQVDGHWSRVGQGRQWLDEDGRHCLIMLSDNSVREIILHSQTLLWVVKPVAGSKQII